MLRQVRIEYEGATYQVMCRGDRRAVRRQTTVRLRWLAEQLVMGSAVNVSRLTAR